VHQMKGRPTRLFEEKRPRGKGVASPFVVPGVLPRDHRLPIQLPGAAYGALLPATQSCHARGREVVTDDPGRRDATRAIAPVLSDEPDVPQMLAERRVMLTD